MKIPLHSLFRKKLRSLLYSVLSTLTHRSENKTHIDKNEISSIVIIRPNYRIGNIILLTPLITELQNIIPDAKIDIIVGMKLAGDILEPMDNINKIIDIPREFLLHPLRMLQLIQNTRSKHYDLALNISAGSVSSELVTMLVNAKYKASFKNNKTFINLTHTVQREGCYTHSGSRPLELLKLFTSDLPSDNKELDIKLTTKELQEGEDALNLLLQKHNIEKRSKVIALFRNARFDKKIDDDWWNEWHQELLKEDSDIVIIDVLSPDILTKLNEKCLEYSNKNLRMLGSFFHACDVYISADTGPMHLACASKAKTVALFNKTDIQTYGTLGSDNVTIDIETKTPKDIALLTNKILRA